VKKYSVCLILALAVFPVTISPVYAQLASTLGQISSHLSEQDKKIYSEYRNRLNAAIEQVKQSQTGGGDSLELLIEQQRRKVKTTVCLQYDLHESYLEAIIAAEEKDSTADTSREVTTVQPPPQNPAEKQQPSSPSETNNAAISEKSSPPNSPSPHSQPATEQIATKQVPNDEKTVAVPTPMGETKQVSLPKETPSMENPEELFKTGKAALDRKDYTVAFDNFSQSAQRGNAAAQNALGKMYSKGRGVNHDYGEAVKWYRKAAEQGNERGQFNLGVSYSEGQGVPKDNGEAFKCYRKAAEQGDKDAQYNLAVSYTKGLGVPKDNGEALKWYRKAEEQGDESAQYALGKVYSHGLGVPQDNKEALKWFRKSAEQGNAEAQNALGKMYSNGQGVTQDYKEAVKWYRKAAEQGHVKAQQELPALQDTMSKMSDGEKMLQAGNIAYDKKGYEEAMEFFRKGAQLGDASCQLKLGDMYSLGVVPQDYGEALKWYRKAADDGNEHAPYQIGMMYYTGRGVTQDYKEALKWLLLAKERGDQTVDTQIEELKRLTIDIGKSGQEIPCVVRTVGYEGLHLNSQLKNAHAYLNKQTGQITFKFDWDPRFADSGFHFLIRLFDANGQCLNYFTTPERFYTDYSPQRLPGQINLEQANIIQYPLSMLDASLITACELGIAVH
jgi:TPR repeat protein